MSCRSGLGRCWAISPLSALSITFGRSGQSSFGGGLLSLEYWLCALVFEDGAQSDEQRSSGGVRSDEARSCDASAWGYAFFKYV